MLAEVGRVGRQEIGQQEDHLRLQQRRGDRHGGGDQAQPLAPREVRQVGRRGGVDGEEIPVT